MPWLRPNEARATCLAASRRYVYSASYMYFDVIDADAEWWSVYAVSVCSPLRCSVQCADGEGPELAVGASAVRHGVHRDGRPLLEPAAIRRRQQVVRFRCADTRSSTSNAQFMYAQIRGRRLACWSCETSRAQSIQYSTQCSSQVPFVSSCKA